MFGVDERGVNNGCLILVGCKEGKLIMVIG